jgi:hypothetical protein
MKYIVRAVKYFISVCVLAALIILVLVLLGYVSSDVDVMFQQGWKSIGYIAIMFAVVSAIYPRFGYKKRLAGALGDFADLRPGVVSYMEEHGYVLESEDEEKMTFRSRSVLNRIFRVWEDRVTIEKTLGGFEVEGLTRDITRIVYGLEYKFRNPDN